MQIIAMAHHTSFTQINPVFEVLLSNVLDKIQR